MGKKTNLKIDVSEVPAHLRELGWKLCGLGHLIANQERDSVPAQRENYGVGCILREIGEQIVELSSALEGTE